MTAGERREDGPRAGLMSRPWFHIGRPWADRPGLVYAGDEDPHVGTFVLDCGEWFDDLYFGVPSEKTPADIQALADHVVALHNVSLVATPTERALTAEIEAALRSIPYLTNLPPTVEHLAKELAARLDAERAARAPERERALVELAAAVPGTCDWGGCDNNALLARHDPEKGWLPVCQWHAGSAGAAELAPITAVAFEELWEQAARAEPLDVETLARALPYYRDNNRDTCLADAAAILAALPSVPAICGVACPCGPNGELLACAHKPGHEPPDHSWATLPTFTGAARAPIYRMADHAPGADCAGLDAHEHVGTAIRWLRAARAPEGVNRKHVAGCHTSADPRAENGCWGCQCWCHAEPDPLAHRVGLPPGPYRVEWPAEQGGAFTIWGRQGTPPDFKDGWAIPLVARGVDVAMYAICDMLNASLRAARAEPGLREGLRRVFHDEYERGMTYGGCVHKNQHQKSWDCADRADEVMEGLAALEAHGKPQEGT
jgi:hypothetical protein